MWYNNDDYDKPVSPHPARGRQGEEDGDEDEILHSVGDDKYLCIENGKPTRVVRGEPDPFSRVERPVIRWTRVQQDLPYLLKREIGRAKRSKIAYTRLWEER
jgi:hypothetical protein